MFGLTKREQRWKAEQQLVDSILSIAATALQARIAEAKVEEARLLKEAAEKVQSK